MVADMGFYTRWHHLLANDHSQRQPLYTWRSGVKHDCAKVMELRTIDGGYRNGLGDVWALEPDYLYPMYKSAEIAAVPVAPPQRWMLVTQKSVGESTTPISLKAPVTWRYLQQYKDALDRRRSSIYRKRPRFAVFGVGNYTFAHWKVAISGMHKQLRFVVVGPYRDRPVVFDDTCYFIPCRARNEAHIVADLLNSEPAQQCLGSFVFWNDKRPITAKVLRNLDILHLAKELNKEEQLLAHTKRNQTENTARQVLQPRLLDNQNSYQPEDAG